MTSGAAPTSVSTRRRRVVPGYGVLVGAVYGVCVIGMSLSVVAEMLLGYTGTGDQPRSLGEQLAGVLGFGTAFLVLSLLAVRVGRGSPQRSRGVAVVVAAAAVPALAFFWCGAPGLLGAAAARLAGLTGGGLPTSGVPRVAGLVGLVLALLNPVVHVLLVGGSWLSELA